MCGIAGFIDPSAGAQGRAILERMTAVIAHRGPDADGLYCNGPAFLGHRRLSIIDISDAGRNPMPNEDGSAWIIYNGEIFNHADVRPELERAGHRYRGRSDTETLLHAWEQYGGECLHRFRGMFAFAIWDQKGQTLFAARDRLGIKPFYYFFDGRLFAFASEIKALLEHPAISAALNEEVLGEYVAFGYGSGERTLFDRIHKLMPGHALTASVQDGAVRLDIERYWDLPAPSSPDRRSEQELIAECRRRLEETVRMRLMSDVPLGVFLSGGLDSSAIAALMTRFVPEPIKTFSVGYREAAFSELGYARQVAQSLSTDHHEVTIGMEEFFNTLPQLVWHEDEPICWPSSVSLYFVSRLAAQHVKVVLTGEGSDELFAGYSRYRLYRMQARWLPYYRTLPEGVRSGIRGAIANSSLLSATLRRKLRHTFLGRGEDLPSLYLDNFYCAFSAAELSRFMRRHSSDPYANFLSYWNSADTHSLLARMLRADQKTYLVELLMKQDQMSMACSIESRVPLLDHTFVEFSATLPDQMKLRGTGKYIVKKALEGSLPDDIIYRKKMGFPTPIRTWLRDDRARPLWELLRSPDGFLAEYFERREINTLIDRHLNQVEDCTDRLWRLINLQLWGDIFLAGRRSAPWQGLLTQAAAAPALA